LKAVELFRKYVPGCEKAFIARTSPSLNIRRGRLIQCDYDISHEDVVEGRHFDDPRSGSLKAPAAREVADNERDERATGSRSASPHG
jgi:hypothetical protein